MNIRFTKMHGLGNDFVVVEAAAVKAVNLAKLAKQICRRREGIGADQLLWLGKSRKADLVLRIFNADGGEVEMCGNGLRCAARYARDRRIVKKTWLTIETLGGIRAVKAMGKKMFQVNMGVPILKGRDIPVSLSGRVINRPIRLDGRDARVTCVSMGNPHCVVFVENVVDTPVAKIGPQLETHALFPKKTNVEFVQVVKEDLITVRVWERGAGETLACGSGACASAVASVLNGLTNRKLTVQLPGGPLAVNWDRDSGEVSMTGPAEEVFTGDCPF